MKPEDIVSAYDALIQRVLDKEIVSSWNNEFARLVVHKETAYLVSPRANSEYDSCVVESETSKRFPLALLSASDKEIDEWKTETKRLDELAHKRWIEKARAEREAEERAALRTLKAKYGE